mmetsp:Transcript_50451/g.126681  ORF Transcript_50451/g.126681 Transcript_50451/m.126681 type:complete len:227 (+) Transcript_50451:193-873(+)
MPLRSSTCTASYRHQEMMRRHLGCRNMALVERPDMALMLFCRLMMNLPYCAAAKSGSAAETMPLRRMCVHISLTVFNAVASTGSSKSRSPIVPRWKCAGVDHTTPNPTMPPTTGCVVRTDRMSSPLRTPFWKLITTAVGGRNGCMSRHVSTVPADFTQRNTASVPARASSYLVVMEMRSAGTLHFTFFSVVMSQPPFSSVSFISDSRPTNTTSRSGMACASRRPPT